MRRTPHTASAGSPSVGAAHDLVATNPADAPASGEPKSSAGPLALEIADLLLDLENPRFAGAKSQREAMQKILDDQGEKLVALAESIVETGTNPMDRLLVVRVDDEGSFVVIEGNRRLAALKILANPTVLDGLALRPYMRKSFDRLGRAFDRSKVEPLACFQVADRAEGNIWIHLRHTGENGGKGIVGWSGLAASRFRGRDPALQALEFVRTHGNLSDEERERLDDRFPITTLDRLLSSRDIRQRLGFDVRDGKLVSGLPADELMKPLRRIVTDLAAKRIKVSGLMNKAQQAKYVEEFDSASKPNLKKLGTEKPVEAFGETDFAQTPKAKPRRKRQPDPAGRRTLVPRRAKLAVTDNRIAVIFRELSQLKVDDAPNAIAVLFRVFLELSVDHYMEQKGMPTHFKEEKGGKTLDKSLKQKVREVVDHIVENGGNRKDYQGVIRALSVEHSPLHIDLLNAYVHNRFATPKSRDLVASWDEA